MKLIHNISEGIMGFDAVRTPPPNVILDKNSSMNHRSDSIQKKEVTLEL